MHASPPVIARSKATKQSPSSVIHATRWRLLRRFAPRNDMMQRLLASCLASLLLYALMFCFILDRPLSLGFLQQQIDAKLTRKTSIGGPKLMILAGSNGP